MDSLDNRPKLGETAGALFLLLLAPMVTNFVRLGTRSPMSGPIVAAQERRDVTRGSSPSSSTRATPKPLKCSIVAWNPEKPRPVLKVLCPPEAVFAPLRIKLGFSWLSEKDIPDFVEKIVAPFGSLTQISVNSEEALVWLRVRQPGKEREQWVRFNDVQSISLVTEP